MTKVWPRNLHISLRIQSGLVWFKTKPIGFTVSWLLLIRGHFRQLRREEAFLFFLVQWQPCGRDDARGDEDDQVLFGVLFDVSTERSANKWNVANDRNFIFCLLHVFAH